MAKTEALIFLLGFTSFTNGQNDSKGFFGSLARYPFETMQTALKKGAELQKSAISFAMDKANTVATGVLDARKAAAKNVNAALSKTAFFTTQAATNIADKGAGFVPQGTVLGTIANTGAKVFRAGASTMHAVAQTGIEAAQAAKMLKLNAMKAGVSAGTGIAETVANSAIGLNHGLVNTGLNVASAGAGMVGSAVDVGVGTLKSAADSAGALADRVTATSNRIAAGAMGSIQRMTN